MGHMPRSSEISKYIGRLALPGVVAGTLLTGNATAENPVEHNPPPQPEHTLFVGHHPHPETASGSLEIRELRNWNIENSPQYTDTDGKDRVFVAIWGEPYVNVVHIQSNEVKRWATGPGTNPLDVKYDVQSGHTYVASADPKGYGLRFDENGQLAAKVDLSTYTGQGESVGGVQGVTIDAEGNAWWALAYADKPKGGVIIKTGQDLTPKAIVKGHEIHNPNGIFTSPDGQTIYICSDTGKIQVLDAQTGSYKETIDFKRSGSYRGTSYKGKHHATKEGHDILISFWDNEAQLGRYNTETNQMEFLPSAPLANDITVQETSTGKTLIWTAGDRGIGVTSYDGKDFATYSVNKKTNGTTHIDDYAFFASYSPLNSLHGVTTEKNVRPLGQTTVFLPIVTRRAER